MRRSRARTEGQTLTMSLGRSKRTRTARILAEIPRSGVARVWESVQRSEVSIRIGLATLAVVAIVLVTQSWAPPRGYRLGYVPSRNITAEIDFKQPDPAAQEKARNRARALEPWVYKHDPKEIQLLRAALVNAVSELVQAPTLAEATQDTWKAFQPPNTDPAPAADSDEAEKQFREFRAALGEQAGLPQFEAAISKALQPFEERGLLDKLPVEHDEGNQKEIAVYPIGRTKSYLAQLNEVLIGQGDPVINRLKENLPPPVATRVAYWIKPRIQPTLTLDQAATQTARDAAAAAVPAQFSSFEKGKTLVPAGKAIDPDLLKLLELERDQLLAQSDWWRHLQRGLAMFCLIGALFAINGYYILDRDRSIISDLQRLATLLVCAVGATAVIGWTVFDPGFAQLLPLLLFAVTMAIAYRRDLAWVMSLSLAIVLSMAGELGFGQFFILIATVTAAIVQLDEVRTRSKLIQVGAISGLIAAGATSIAGVLDDQPWAWPLWESAARNGLWTLAAGFLMTGVLPWVEKWFGVLTELSLLEWSDVSHPLLQELVRRAPGTYNHSINVASLAEAAAEAVEARGLLVRVGAYFHDIGKMAKPDYFVENQLPGSNRHDTLVPAMSTLIIIAHIKDGADLAMQHHLPQAIIDFIEQHHGTTLVEYFYRRATEQSDPDANGNGNEVHESAFRYPGPKPQTIEAAVLMLADSVESASRTLVEPTPARIESIVEKIAMHKLLDGQFDECDLTLEQLRTIQDSLVKSLTAVYHGRVKYPSQATA